jgi:hypothetical protein
MALSYHQLDLGERRTIFRLLNVKVLVATIAHQLGGTAPPSIARSGATISTTSAPTPATSRSSPTISPENAASGGGS